MLERFRNYALVRRLDATDDGAEFYEAHPADSEWERRMLVRVRDGRDRWMPWADPAIAKVLVHPNIVRMYECDAFARAAYFVFELVDGIDLRELLRGGPLPPDVACLIAGELSRGLAHALESRAPNRMPLKWVHGRLNLRALMLSKMAEVKVWGYGIGRVKPGRGTALESLGYQSPEQAAGAPEEDPRIDVFLTGAVLHEMLTGAPIIRATDEVDHLRVLLDKDIRSYSADLPDLSSSLKKLLEEMLARDPARRPRDAFEVLARIESLAESRDPEAARIRLARRVQDA